MRDFHVATGYPHMTVISRRSLPRVFPVFPALFAAFAAMLGACSATGEGTGRGQGGIGPLNVTTDLKEPQEFVRQSRPAAPTEFIPVGVTPPARSAPVRSAADVEALEKKLNADRNRSRGFAARPKPPSAYDGRLPSRPNQPKAPATE